MGGVVFAGLAAGQLVLGREVSVVPENKVALVVFCLCAAFSAWGVVRSIRMAEAPMAWCWAVAFAVNSLLIALWWRAV
jgi:hypothetical protein